MKSEKGITLISLSIYIMTISIAIGILSIISQYFYSNVSYISEMGKYASEYNKFNMYFIKDIKNNTDVYSISDNKIVFDDGNMYTYSNGAIYRNKIKICSNIKECIFKKIEETDDNNFTKKIINVNVLIDGTKVFAAEDNYVLKYW